MNELIALALLEIPVVVLQALILLELRKIRDAAARTNSVFKRCFPTEVE